MNESSGPFESSISRLIQYWRNSLADTDKMDPFKLSGDQGEQFPTALLQQGILPAKQIERFFIKAEEGLREKNNKRKQYKQNRSEETKEEEDIIVNNLTVIVAPYTAVQTYEHGQKFHAGKEQAILFPLCLTATLDRDGHLTPQLSPAPWITRGCLSPNHARYNSLIIGDITDVDNFYTQHASRLSKDNLTWKDLLAFAFELFDTVVGKERDKIKEQNFTLQKSGQVLPCYSQQGISKNIIGTYDEYIDKPKNKKIPALLQEFCSFEPRSLHGNKPDAELFIASRHHLGQMQNTYPLSASQRTSLSYFFDEKDNAIFAVNGPPGTGKTSLLLSIIAGGWVKAAIEKTSPPLVVASAANNQGITNILDHFKEHQIERWLPNLDNYGLYLTSDKKTEDHAQQLKKYIHCFRARKTGSVNEFYATEYHATANRYFLEKFNAYYRQNATELKKCQDHLHAQMVQKQMLLNKIIEFCHDYHALQKNMTDSYGSLASLDAIMTQKKVEELALQKNLEQLEQLEKTWLSYKTTDLKWLRLGCCLPLIKTFAQDMLKDKMTLFCKKQAAIFSTVITDIAKLDHFLQNKIQDISQKTRNLTEIIAGLEAHKEKHAQFATEKIALEAESGLLIDTSNLFNFTSDSNVLAQLDTTLRYDLFCLAAHYWEVTWLLTSQSIDSLKYHFEDQKKYWQLMAMILPCLVTTLHAGTGFFRHTCPGQEFETVSDFLDLLIVDEAGQAMPAVAGALISTAKRLLLVGDVQQIEPICLLPESIDAANAKKFGLYEDKGGYELLKARGVLCSSDAATGHAYGNVLVVGQRKAKYHLKQHVWPGMLLLEHRRCAKDIIDYCNKLCYNNQLQCLTKEKSCHYPRMGYAHIKGHEEKIGTSRINKHEAKVISAWLAKNHSKILETCQLPTLDECVGILTPFAQQAKIIRAALRSNNLTVSKVGTTHTLQGAEKPIIIFSPVYNAEQAPDMLFFDKLPNMLNVAVSRAERSFLVFGDMDLFDSTKDKRPSALLANYLFKSEDNEIVDIIQPRYDGIGNHEIKQLNSLEQHRFMLKAAFAKAYKELNIVSPFLTPDAIQSDKIPELIAQYHTNICINIYTDPTFYQTSSTKFTVAKNLLKNAGANVFHAPNVHSKIIAIDDKIIIEGSFNWLSSQRTIKKFQREESSLVYQGDQAARFIEEALRPIRKKAHAYEIPMLTFG